MNNEKKEIVTIQIVVAVNIDEEAIALKKKISEAIVDVPDAQMKFSMMSINPKGLHSNGDT